MPGEDVERVGGTWGVTANRYGVSFGNDENVLRLMMIVQVCEYTNTIKLYT